jgi:hypothetical protein
MQMSKPPENTTLADVAHRAEFASRLALRLIMFPLTPQPGDSHDEHAKCLETSFALEITKALNEEAARADR